MGNDKCFNDPACVASTNEYLILKLKAEDMASTSRRFCKDAKGLIFSSAIAATIAIFASYFAVSISDATGTWFNVLGMSTIGIGVAATVACAITGSAGLAALSTYRSTLTKARSAKSAMSDAYIKMIENCNGECAPSNQFDLHC
ncbi:MAG: hypothetical protein HKO66_04385 [Saprospiraceae bacterium]|nr:hypothetical protein [Saprospiraceae bacterium]NNL91448.1 hypothetical protein [Saprospiraceae bacterium]